VYRASIHFDPFIHCWRGPAFIVMRLDVYICGMVDEDFLMMLERLSRAGHVVFVLCIVDN